MGSGTSIIGDRLLGDATQDRGMAEKVHRVLTGRQGGTTKETG